MEIESNMWNKLYPMHIIPYDAIKSSPGFSAAQPRPTSHPLKRIPKPHTQPH